MPKLLYSSETVGCGATIQLDSGETCLVSVAQTGVLVKCRRGRFGQLLVSMFGAELYRERNVYKAATTAINLDQLFPRRDIPVAFKNPVLAAFANAVWNSSTAAEAAITLNEATAKTSASPAALLDALGELMENYPTALMDTARLPASKQTMKTVIKEVWRQEPRLRSQLMHAYLHLSQFQDGIGEAVLDCKLPDLKKNADGTPDLEAVRQLRDDPSGPLGENFTQWIEWSKVSMAEMEILTQEWQAFEREANATAS